VKGEKYPSVSRSLAGGALHSGLQLRRVSAPNPFVATALGETRRPGAHDAFNALDEEDLFALTYTSSSGSGPKRPDTGAMP
jgi:hypothetical protein